MIGVFPAPAGMNRLLRFVSREVPGVPRARGDEPLAAWFAQKTKECSPRPRG